MDLTTLSFIVIVLFFSLLSMLFISRFLPKGKSFEEMLKEKREMREKILGLTSPTPPTKSSKESANKRTKKSHSGGNANQNQKNRGAKQQQQQHQRVEVVEPESDGHSSESPLEEEINPLTYGSKKRTGQATNLTVEYAETEAFPLSDNAGGNKKKDNKQQQGGKKNKQKAAGGILVNKSEPVLVKPVETVPEMNHFAEIHPKDALEIARQQKHEDDTKAGKNQTPKEQRQQNKGKKDHQSKQSPKTNAPAHVAEQQHNQHHQQQHHAAPQVAAEPKKQPHADNKPNAAVSAQKDKSSKRKKNELITQELAVEMADAANVHSLVNILNKADLPRNDIQILIDFLLNKQQDTLAKDPSEWNDPSDPLQKLKKQLQEKEAALLEEQKAAAGLHAKLKELRQELNGEKVQAGAVLKGYVEELNNKKQEIHHLTQELGSVKDKLANDKQAMSIQFQQLQAKYIQLSKEHASMQDHGATIAQLNNDLQLLQQELMAKSQLLNEKLQSEEEMMKKKTEYEILLHNNDELMRQRVQELTAYENDLRQLRLELSQKDELSQTCQQQSYEIEQLKAELQAKQKQAVAAASAAAAAAHATSQADESNRVEMRNLQNALDSTKSKLEVYRNELVECKSLMTDYKQQTNELKAKEEQLQKQLEEQRQKNDNLRTKNWKLVEALQDAERRRGTQTTPAGGAVGTTNPEKVEQQQKLINSSAEKVDIGKVVLEEQNRTKDLLVQLLQPIGVVSALPVDATDFQSWLEATVGCIKEQYEKRTAHPTTNSTANSSSSTNSSHPEQSSGTANSSSSSSSNSDSSRLNSSSNIIANNNLNTSNSVNSSLHANSNDGGAVVITNKNGASGGDSGSDDDQQSIALRYEQLQQTVDQYKSIIADTENMLKNLEAKVTEQDNHWRTVVQAKDKELNLLKSAGAVGQ
ncbi:ribosome-binding protein 1 isoform X1 [Anopheles stephensi]|uniref:ribosome-binding protein 1 isoform X1 n=1 Tax=Anopheles stephensi TaxID=30069 RepID=UPI0016588D44|nr:ribosome-binding protein 1 isoform X1 [Anopheles stephensi]XP_035900409.1 ribosome-binding protein 1 isoform X1 [Anopheles stephensi]XP_035900410.1 ribosome-binding protein 1 isoform X1 [Anopheles stephensi]